MDDNLPSGCQVGRFLLPKNHEMRVRKEKLWREDQLVPTRWHWWQRATLSKSSRTFSVTLLLAWKVRATNRRNKSFLTFLGSLSGARGHARVSTTFISFLQEFIRLWNGKEMGHASITGPTSPVNFWQNNDSCLHCGNAFVVLLDQSDESIFFPLHFVASFPVGRGDSRLWKACAYMGSVLTPEYRRFNSIMLGIYSLVYFSPWRCINQFPWEKKSRF